MHIQASHVIAQVNPTKLRDLWVLGDIHGLIAQIDDKPYAPPELTAAKTASGG